MLGKVFGISLTAKPQVGIYNKHSDTLLETYTIPSSSTKETPKEVKDVALSYAMPVSLSLTFSF